MSAAAVPPDAPAGPRGGAPRAGSRDAWLLSLAAGLAILMVACGLALAFGWVHLERAMDVRTLFR